jgi:hypothetical protein
LSADPFTDVAKDFWGAVSIKFGVDNGYINGMGDGTFHPGDDVTTAQLATMLDKLLGYSVADINYQWPENAMAKATISELLLDVTKGSYESLTRDDAAQMLFNALKATDQVKSTETGSQGDVDGTTRYRDVPSTEDKEYYNPPNALGAAPFTEQLIEKYFPNVTLDTNSLADDFGRESTVWKNGTDKITDEILDTPAFVYTSNKTGADLKKDLSAYDFAEDGELWINGLSFGFGENYDYRDVVTWTQNGHRVELYKNSKGNAIDRIVVEYYIPVKVTKNKDGKIEFDEGYHDITDNDDLYGDISSVKKNDYIMAAPAWDTLHFEEEDVDIEIPGPTADILAAYIPEHIQGTVTRVVKGTDKYDSVLKYDLYQENSSATIGGKEYSAGSYSDWQDEATDIFNYTLDVDSKKVRDAYLDKYGYVAFWKNADNNDEAADWGLLRSVYRTSSTNDYGEVNNNWYGQIVDESGTVQYFKLNDKDDDTTALVEGITGGSETRNNFMTNMLVTYKSGAKGYTLDTVDVNDEGEVISEGITSGRDDEVKTDDRKIGDAYIASDVKVITVKGDKTTKIEASVENGITKKIAAPFKYVVKKDDSNNLVKTIYIVKTSANRSEDLIYVSKDDVEELLYTDDDEKQAKGTVVEYYSEADQNPTTMIVAGTDVDKGWYAGYDTDGEATVLDTRATAADGVVVEGTIDSIYGDTITIRGIDGSITDYSITDLAIRDTREDEDIDSVEALTDAVKDAKDNEEPALTVTFAYDTDSDDDIKPITQLYLLDVDEDR